MANGYEGLVTLILKRLQILTNASLLYTSLEAYSDRL